MSTELLKKIRETLPHIEKIWVNEKEWHINPQPNTTEVTLDSKDETNSQVENPVKQSKKKDNGTK